MIQKDKIKKWIKNHDKVTYRKLYEDATFVPVFKPQKILPKEAVNIALKDAENFIASGNNLSAVDRVHTAMHGYFQALCDENGLKYVSDDGLTKLYKIIREEAIDSKNQTSAEGIKKILNSLSACVDSLNTLRNQASMAHPNNELLGEAEAALVVNTASTILHYLEAKLG